MKIEINGINDFSNVKDLLRFAIDYYQMSFATFSKILDIQYDDLIKIYNGDVVFLEDKVIIRFIGILYRLIKTLPIDHKYTKMLIESLKDILEVDFSTISVISDLSEEKIKKYYLGLDILTDEDYNKLLISVFHIFSTLTQTDRSFGTE